MFPGIPAAKDSFFLRSAVPLIVAGGYLGVLWLILPHSTFLVTAGLMGAYFIPPAGRESLIPLGIAAGIPWWLMVVSLTVTDVVTALVVAVNFDLAARIPVVGRVLDGVVHEMESYLEAHPVVREFSLAGLILFIFVPVFGSGGIGGSVAGRLIGLSPSRVVMAMAVGSGLSCLAIAAGSEVLYRFLGEVGTPALIAVSILLAIVSGIYIIHRRVRPPL
ncbi:MAG: small multi-drug export protein [Methanoculleaceae archaeon]